METYYMEESWRARLLDAGLDSLQKLLAYDGGVCLSTHLRGDTRRIELQKGQCVFLKRDFFTFKKEIAKDLLRFRKPQPKTEKERRAFAAVLGHGFIAPQVVAWGQTRRWGFPDRAAFIMLPLAGVNLDEYLRKTEDEHERQSAVAKAEETLGRLQREGFDWPDHKPEHFFVMDDGGIGLIDLERLQVTGHPLSNEKCERQLERFRRLLPKL